MPTDNSDWLLFLSLEKDFMATFDYVAIEECHKGVFSVAYLKILLAACASVEQVAKRHCGMLEQKRTNAKEIAEEIIRKERALKERGEIKSVLWELECSIPRHQLRFCPWASFGIQKPEAPSWWIGNDDAKHSSVRQATQMNVLDCLAGLFCLNLAYYGDAVKEFDPPALYDHKVFPPHMVTSSEGR